MQDWQGVFLHFDRDRSGSIDGNELQAALTQFGYRLSPQLLTLVQRKYGMLCSCPCCFVRTHNLDMQGSAPAAGGYRAAAPPGITFDRFVRACVVVKQITETFVALDTDRDGWVQINYDKFLQTVLTLP
jgi:Ca2+-binding EF-hand superfamily protein